MSDQLPPVEAPDAGSPVEAPRKDPTTVWKALTAALAVLVVALGGWAISLLGTSGDAHAQSNEDAATIDELRATNDDLTSQNNELTQTVEALSADKADLEMQLTELTDRADQITVEAQKAIESGVTALNVPADRQTLTEQEVSNATAALKTATDALAAAPNDPAAQRAQAAALSATAQLCAAGTTGALSDLSSSDVAAAGQALKIVAPACDAAFAPENQLS